MAEGMKRVKLLVEGPFQYSGPHYNRKIVDRFPEKHPKAGQPIFGDPVGEPYDHGIYHVGDVFDVGERAYVVLIANGTVADAEGEDLTYPPGPEQELQNT